MHSTNIPSFAQPIREDILQAIRVDCQQLNNNFSSQLNQPEDWQIAMNDRYVAIAYRAVPLYYLNVEFELKFEVIFQSRVPHSQRGAIDLTNAKQIGFKLFHVGAEPISIFMQCEKLVDVWVKFLSKLINQFGFHELFKPLRKLGKGSTATVYEVERLTDGQCFAVKAFAKQSTINSGKPNSKQSLLNEFTILRQLQHPNLIKMSGIFQSQNSLYLILQPLKAGQMHSRAIKRQCDFKMSEIREFMFGLLNALKYLAEKRIVHRDIKLENIMLRSEDTMEPVLADFGLAEMMDSSQHLFFRCGTPGFVAPEIINMEGEKQVDPQCDIFSAGLILHILLTRRPLFEGADFKAVYESNKKLNFDLHRPAYNTLNPEALDLMRKMLVINPRQRITAVEAMHHSFFGYGGVMLPAPLQNLESNPKMSEKTTLNPDSYREISEYH